MKDPGRRKWLVLLAVGLGTFMSALDGSVVNTILPVIRAQFQSDVASVEWVVVVYLLAISGLLLTFGRLGDLNGHRRIYLTGFLIFVGASALCGLAPGPLLLVLARGLQAVGGAMLFANAPAILTASFPPNQRGQALGLQAMMTYLGLTAGPSLGGALAQALGWRSVFYINLPIGLLAFFLCLAFVEHDQPLDRAGKFDLPGAGLFMAGLVALMLGLNQGNSWGWGSVPVLICLGAAAVLLAGFVVVERRSSSPMLDLALFRIRLFSISTASAMLNYISLYSVIFLMPFYLIQGRGLNPAQAGLLLTAQPLVMAAVTAFSGYLSDKIGSRLLATGGMAVMAVGLFLLSRLGPAAENPAILLALAVTGLGTGIFVSPNTSALLGSAPPQRRGIASGILATARNSGMVLGIGLAGAVLSTALAQGGEGALFAGVAQGFTLASAVAALGAVISFTRG